MPLATDPTRPEWFVHTEALPAGTRYSYSLDGGDAVPDPRARRLPEGVHGPAEVWEPSAGIWSDQDWNGIAWEDAVLYELHVGTFTDDGTLDAAIGGLDHLVELGITLVELMPLAAFDGEWGWGYDGVALSAVHEPYGGPDALVRFVDAAHARGVGVVLDVVHNHLGPSGNYLPLFGPYFTDKYHTPWGSALNLDGEGSDEVRAFLRESAIDWLRDFHLDGLRLDAVHELVEVRAVPFLEELTTAIGQLSRELGRPLHVIAESDRNDQYTVLPTSEGGLGLTAQWDDDIHHALHSLLTGETTGYYVDFATPGDIALPLATGYRHAGTWSTFRGRTHGRPLESHRVPAGRLVASLQTHDQVGNRAVGERLAALVADPGVAAAGAALLLLLPMTPMLFMGEEWAASTPWQYFTSFPDKELGAAVRTGRRSEFARFGWDAEDIPDPQDIRTRDASVLDWAECERPGHARMLRWYRDLLELRRDLNRGSDRPLQAWRPLEVSFGELDPAGRPAWVALDRGVVQVIANLGSQPVTPAAAVTRETPDLAWGEAVPGDMGLELGSYAVAVVRAADPASGSAS